MALGRVDCKPMCVCHSITFKFFNVVNVFLDDMQVIFLKSS